MILILLAPESETVGAVVSLGGDEPPPHPPPLFHPHPFEYHPSLGALLSGGGSMSFGPGDGGVLIGVVFSHQR